MSCAFSRATAIVDFGPRGLTIGSPSSSGESRSTEVERTRSPESALRSLQRPIGILAHMAHTPLGRLIPAKRTVPDTPKDLVRALVNSPPSESDEWRYARDRMQQ